MCGQLHCTPADKLVSYQPLTYLTIDSHVTVGARVYECDSAIIDVGAQFTDPGLAPNGAKCADGKVNLISICGTFYAVATNTDFLVRCVV